jgi:hypothetical protein
MEKAKRDLQGLKAKLGSSHTLQLSWEAKRILRLFAQGTTDWQRGEYRNPWKVNYREALERYGAELSKPENASTKTIYWLMFMIQFRGGRDSEKATKSLNEFWLLARKISPKAVEKLVDDKDWKKEFLADLDESLAKIYEEAEKPEEESCVARRYRKDARVMRPRVVGRYEKSLVLVHDNSEVDEEVKSRK